MNKREYALESMTKDGFYQPVDASLLPVTRVEAANLIRALQQLEVIAKRQAPRIAFKVKGRILFLDLADIFAVQAEGNYVSLRHRSNPYLVHESLSFMAERLKPYGFIRIHRSVVREYFGRGGDPTFADGRVQAACKRWKGILGNAYIQTQHRLAGQAALNGEYATTIGTGLTPGGWLAVIGASNVTSSLTKPKCECKQ
jgi:LytTr DNA-binding domain